MLCALLFPLAAISGAKLEIESVPYGVPEAEKPRDTFRLPYVPNSHGGKGSKGKNGGTNTGEDKGDTTDQPPNGGTGTDNSSEETTDQPPNGGTGTDNSSEETTDQPPSGGTVTPDEQPSEGTTEPTSTPPSNNEPQSAPATNRYRDRVGFASHTNYLPEEEGGKYLERATSIGVRWFREDFWWSVLEPKRGEFNWSATDALMRNAARYDANVVAVAGYAPGWASGHTESDKFPPSNPQDYARFCVALVKRYGNGGSFWEANPDLRPAPLRAIELWNEPWYWRFWGPDADPAGYASLVRAAAPAVKAAAPDVKVLISGDLHVGYRDGRENSWLNGWLAQLLREDLPMGSVDGWSVHPYSGNRGPYQATIEGFADQTYARQWLFQQLPLIRDMTAEAGKFKPLWATEFGWSTTGDVTEAQQAEFVQDALRRAVDEWGDFVERSFLYTLERPHNGDRDGGCSLLRDDGSPKPAWRALAALLT